MTTAQEVKEIAGTLRGIYARNPDQGEQAIANYLEDRLGGLDPDERLQVLGRLEELFPLSAPIAPEGKAESLISLLLGTSVSGQDIDSPETLRRLGESLSVIFTALNDLIFMINSSLGGAPGGDETIRHIIGSSLAGEGRLQSIEEYLSQIRRAFLVAQQASKEAARTIAGQIIQELDPKNMESSGRGFRIGPLKKAEAFDSFEEKYQRVAKWFESERFLTDFLRQFEKSCQKAFS
jgi:hypothetical protein